MMRMATNKKIFITGASSFLGSNLVDRLRSKYEVTLLEHSKALGQKEGVEIVHGGLENISEWEDSLSGVDIIVHLAGVTHVKNIELYRKINTKGTYDLINAA